MTSAPRHRLSPALYDGSRLGQLIPKSFGGYLELVCLKCGREITRIKDVTTEGSITFEARVFITYQCHGVEYQLTIDYKQAIAAISFVEGLPESAKSDRDIAEVLRSEALLGLITKAKPITNDLASMDRLIPTPV